VKETIKNVNILYNKIRDILEKYTLLKEKNKLAKEEIKVLKIDLINSKNELKELKQKYDSLKFSKILFDESDKKLAKRKMKKIINDLDECILTLLS
tara:strand:- start:1027 stop:1314 length:288 start_codon:yes stop_codon:yes gene_type:complete